MKRRQEARSQESGDRSDTGKSKFENRSSKPENRPTGDSRAVPRRSRASGNPPWVSFLFLAVFLAAQAASGQVVTGLPPFGSFSGGPFDTVNNANLNVHASIPIVSKPGRGIPFTYNLAYDSAVWYPVGASGSQVWTPVANWGWTVETQPATGYVTYSSTQGQCPPHQGFQGAYYWIFSSFIYMDAFGAPHSVGLVVSTASGAGCSGPPAQASGYATDGSGYYFNVQAGSGSPAVTLSSRAGVQFVPPLNSNSGVATATDPNGNRISVNSSGVFTDTLGTTPLTVSGSGTPSSPLLLTYSGPQNSQPQFKINYTQQTLETNFACSGITNFGRTTQITAYLVSSITLPDNTSYQFTYESTINPVHSGAVTGRLISVTLPTGGVISYTYSPSGATNNDIVCIDGSAALLNRSTPDTGSNPWQYLHSENGTAWTTTITDPQSNQTTMNFQTIYETERQVAGLETVVTCYNNSPSPCTSVL